MAQIGVWIDYEDPISLDVRTNGYFIDFNSYSYDPKDNSSYGFKERFKILVSKDIYTKLSVEKKISKWLT